uniref:Uncharacterized protein n=1 Tax=uncultured marine thaumarchaeote KM3_85_E11 TaxID=1456317 RepID=A0A075HU64_9ARCH|nr:hypothetical protein [uncultured marine thaumarchaeote KM3_85_E11]
MLIKYNIDDQSFQQEIMDLINAGKYSNIDALVERAIRNLVAEEKHGTVNDPLWTPFLTSNKIELIDYEKVAEEYEKRFDPENNHDRLIKQEDKPYGKLSVGLISHWHNRMLPMKWLLRQFLRYVNESKRKWIDIRGFEDYILNKALPQIEFSLNKSPRTSSLGIPSIAVGFPKIEKSLRREEIDSQRKNQMMYRAMIVARARFFSIYFGKVIQKKLVKVPVYLWEKGQSAAVQNRLAKAKAETFRIKGACFEMGFFECRWSQINEEGGKKPKFSFEIALTPLGLKFAKMENPLLDALERDKPLTRVTTNIFADRFDENGVKHNVPKVFTLNETEFILDNIYRTQNKDRFGDRFVLENEIVKKILDKKPASKVGTPITRKDYHNLFDSTAKKFSKINDDDLTSSRLIQHKSATIMRLVELGLVYRGGQRSREIYVIQPLE